MGMTISEKILADHAGLDKVVPGQLINAKLDIVLANDITAPVAINEFEKVGADKVFDKSRICLVPDHFAPNKDIKSAEQVNKVRKFAKKYEIENFFEVGKMGIEHVLLPEQGIVGPGDLIIGADSHTCTYGALGAFATGVGSTDMAAGMITGEAWFKVPETIKFVYNGKLPKWVSGKDLILYTIGQIGVDGARYMAMEFTGEAIDELSMDGRFTMSNMAIEAGAKAGLIAPDQTTIDYVEGRTRRPYKVYKSDEDAEYAKVYEWDVTNLEPQVAFPHLPENTKGVSEAKDITLNQVVIGSCTNGRIEDMRIAASILKGKKVADGVRLLIFPGTQEVYLQAMEEGLFKIFVEAGSAVSTPTCGPCLGGHMGILAEGERALSTTNRNFVGRMGAAGSEVYLASPAVAAASAVLGRIGSPEEVL
ncbi:3-isopropylmalate dehydratase large subunit [Gallicola sp. Sow4_E12]|uniref:3-isopropylmalate dehydratase large subunit n=1 Tax=Gallicola sp. Sow4_E12 TaxID=3438785 RepID=UPI003F938486